VVLGSGVNNTSPYSTTVSNALYKVSEGVVKLNPPLPHSALKMETAHSSKTLIPIYRSSAHMMPRSKIPYYELRIRF
jgi:hypothetical protein